MTTENNTSNSPKQKPVEVIRDGSLVASIWQRQNDKGIYYATTYAKTYKDDLGHYQSSYSFVGTDHLKLAELSKRAYQKERELYERDRQSVRDYQMGNTEPEPKYAPIQDRERE